MRLRFGPAAPADLARLAELLGELFSHEAEFTPDARKQRRALRLILEDSRRGRIFVAREDGRVVAMASLIFTISTAEGGKAALFEDLVVAPERRGRGIGPRLLRHVIREARKAGVLRLMLLTDGDNERAQALYRANGFVDSSMRAMRLKFGRVRRRSSRGSRGRR
ncbi:MAG: GNAT family N-acetyltransferase [Betaproteobacteria bacterium]